MYIPPTTDAPTDSSSIADDAAGEVDQDRGEGCHAFTVRDLPDGGSRRAAVAVPGDPGADTTVAAARDGAGMTARTVETTGGRGGDGDGLRGSAMNASTQAALGKTTARKRPSYLADEQKGHLRTSRSVVKLSERPTMAVGWRSFGKSRFRAFRPVLYLENGGLLRAFSALPCFSPPGNGPKAEPGRRVGAGGWD